MVFSSNELDIVILQNGKDGVSADSKYFWVKYSQNPDGSDLTDDPNGAIYIGIAYNKDSIIESEIPSDYSWSKIQGDNGVDAYTVILSNENVSFAVDYGTHIATSAQTYSSTVTVFQGIEERKDFTIGEVVSANGITTSKTKDTVTLSVENNTDITSDHGSFRIPISIDGLIFFKDMTWALAQQGKDGTSAINIIIGNEAQNIPCTEEGVVSEGFLINIPFQGYVGTEKVGATAVVGLLPSGVTLGSNSAATSDTDGLIILNVAKGADFGGKNILTGNITITFAVGDQQIVKYFTWSKTKDGAEGSMVIYELEPSSYVISKNLDDTLTPESITFNAYSRMSNSIERVSYEGLFLIEESANGASYSTKYLSSQNESSVTYTPSSADLHSIRCTLCQADQVSITLDRQTIPILKDSDNLKPIIEEITTTMQGLENKVDNVEQSITNKVWQTDITNAVNNYDKSTVKTIRDQVSQQKITIDGIQQTVKDVQTEVSKKADGSTVSSLTEKVSEMKQTVEGFKTEVSETYVSKSDFEDAIGNIEGKSGINWKVNYSDLKTANDNWIYVYSKENQDDGWIMWNAAKVVVPNMSINTNVANVVDTPIYLVMRIDESLLTNYQWILTDESDRILVNEDGDILVLNAHTAFLVWFQSGSGWKSYDLAQKNQEDWEWVNETDAILAMFSRTETDRIHSAKLYTPPLMYNEIGISMEQRSYVEQTADHITQVVEETYATKDTVNSVKSEFTQTANEIKGTVEDLDGEISQVSQKANRIESVIGTKQNVVPTSIRYIRDWLHGSTSNDGNHYVECQIMVGDTNIAKGLTAKAFNSNHISISASNLTLYTDGSTASSPYITVSGGGLWVYLQLDLGEIHRDVDAIRVWHYYSDNRAYNHRLEVSSDGENWVELYNSEIHGGYVEKSSGATYNLNDSNISEKFSKITQTIESITTRVQDNEDNYSELKQDVTGFKSTVSSTYATKESLKNYSTTTQMNSAISQSASSIKTEVSKTYATKDSLKNYPTTAQMTSAIEQSASGINTTISNIKIGGKNLLLGSGVTYTNNAYDMANYYPTELYVTNQQYTVTLCVTPASKVTDYKLYVSGGYRYLATLKVSGTSKQVVSATFTFPGYYTDRVPSDTMSQDAYNSIFRFPNDGTVTGDSTIHWIKVEKGNKATDWTMAPEDLASGGTNLLFNSDFSRTSEQDSGTNKHENIYATRWGGYNSGITNPTTSYHAHVNDDTFGYNVMEFNESDGTRNWKGISQNLSTIKYVADSYILSFDAYATGNGGQVYGGFYYTKSGDTASSFGSGQYKVTNLPINQWGRCFVKVPLNNNVDFSKSIHFYVYSYNFSKNIIVYIKNLKLEEGYTPTAWCPSPEDTEDSITTVQETAAGIMSQVTSLSGKLSRLEQTSDSISAEIESARGSSSSLSVALNNILQRIQDAEGDYSSILQTVDGVSIDIHEVQDAINSVQNTLNTSFDFSSSGLVIKSSASGYNVLIDSNGLYIRSGTTKVAWIDSSTLHIGQATIETSMKLGKFSFRPEDNGSLSFGIF